jgi:phosphoglycerate dehydrogenase-like enzyme
MAQDNQDRLVAVSYPVDEDYARINSEVLAGQAEIVNTHDLDEAGRRAALAKADALLSWTLATEIPPGALDDAGRLGFVQLLSAGVDAVDFTAVPERLTVSSNAGAYAPEMSEHVMAMVLSLAKRLPQRHADMAAGRFDNWTPALVLDGAVCGILGYGGIGVAVARHMRHFGSKIYAITRTGQSAEPADFIGSVSSPADLDHVLAAYDVVLLSLPLTLTTRGLIGARELAVMKPTAILINVPAARSSTSPRCTSTCRRTRTSPRGSTPGGPSRPGTRRSAPTSPSSCPTCWGRRTTRASCRGPC